MNKILVATDGSDSAAQAVEFGIELALEHQAELIFVHVVPALDVVPVSGFGIGGAFPHEPSPEDQRMLDDAAARAEEHDVVPTTVLLAGDTVDEIVAYADSHDVDLIVVGSRGHGAIANALLGSVSRGVLAESKRPVMVVRAGAPIPHTADVRRRAGIGLGY
jgi:nucleotide-binding universal stress UspA family protein